MNEKKKHYLIYQITNLVNGKIYIGKHETTNIEDNYFGSGNLIRAAIKKYGIENFVKTILFELQNEEEMNLLEKCVVTQEFCDREDTYNINVGGDGGWTFVNEQSDFAIGTENRRQKFHSKGGKACQTKFKNSKYKSFTKYYYTTMNKERRAEMKIINSQRAKRYFAKCWIGKHHTNETKQKISSSRKGTLCGKDNGMFDKVWIKNSIIQECILWNKELDIPDGWEYGRCQNFEKSSYEDAEIIMNQIKMHEYAEKEKYFKKIFFTLMYSFYLKFGYKQMIKYFQISMSQSAFCHACKKYVEEYSSWKRWKK